MKDIDFDELDRAVSSVLGQGAVTQDETGEETVTVSSGQNSAQADTAPDQSEPEKPSAEPAAIKSPSLATKRRGMFMDVMHPSANMSSPSPQPALKPVKSLSPLASDIAPEKAADKPDLSDNSYETAPHEPTASLDETTVLVGAEPAPVEALLPEHIAEQASKNNDKTSGASDSEPGVSADATDETSESIPSTSMYVDPLAAGETTDEAPTEEPGAETDTAEDSEALLAASDTLSDASTTDSTTQPSTTPFLSDTNVDKRPLGAFVGAESAASATAEQGSADAMQTPTSPVDAQGAPSVPLPRELQPDVVEVESAQEIESPSTQNASTNDDGRVEGHPLFDTSTYHEPIAAVNGHGMAGWVKWMIGLLACLAVGAGVGYFLFAAGL